MRLEIAEQINRLESCPILSSTARRRDHPAERIQVGRHAILAEKRQVELRLGNSRATSKRWFSTELCEHQLLDWIIEKSPSAANAGFAGVTRTPGDTHTRSKSLVISLRHARRDTGVPWDDQSNRVLRCAIG